MVPEKIAQMLTALKTPDFFTRENRTTTEEIHDILRDYLACATDTMTVEVDMELLALAEKVLKIYGWTVEESLVLYLMWCITCPDDMEAWLSDTDERTVKTDEENPDAVQA